jgi:ABC-type uncharacterized transport system substrate-binding protein
VDPFTVLELDEVQEAAGTLGLEVVTLEIRHAQDIAPAFEALKSRADALYDHDNMADFSRCCDGSESDSRNRPKCCALL